MGFQHNVGRRARLIVALALAMVASPALAGSAAKIYRPVVEQGERELAFRGGVFKDDGSYERVFVGEFSWSPTSRWKTEFAVEYEGVNGHGGTIEAYEWENILLFAEPGEHVVDFGLLLEYEHPKADGPDEVKVGALVQKEFDRVIGNLNLVLEREVGSGAGNDIGVDYGWELKWRGKEALEFGVQGLGELGTLDRFGSGAEHRVGPAVFGLQRLDNGNKIAWDAAVLTRIGSNGPDAQVRFQIEYEMY